MSASTDVQPLISVVIPTHERAELLERTLRSLKGQSLPASEFEVVVVDDGSTDATASVCRRLANELPLRYVRIDKAGTSAAKNLGLFVSAAPLVLFYDDDDLADAGLLEAHVEAHRVHAEDHVAVLGYTTWSQELDVSPLMHYVTDVGQHLFAYQNMEDGQLLDYTYFWAGRISCKRSFMAQHGIFDQDFTAIEDVELGFRLAKHGLQIVHARSAKSFMVRPITFDQFAERCVKHGRGLWLFNRRHPDAAVERHCRVAEALEQWPSLAPSVESRMARVRELEDLHLQEGGLDDEAVSELHGHYDWTFAALRARGIAEAEAEAGHNDRPHEPVSEISPARSRLPEICPDPVFIIGSPRSGTSILAWSLAQHSEFRTEPESDLLYYMLRDSHLEEVFETAVARPDSTWLGIHDVGIEQFFSYLGLGLNALFTATGDGRRWVDQTPANTLVADRLADMFPGARFLHILRDGRRVAHSMINFEQVFADAETLERMKSADRLPRWASDFRDACRTWARFAGTASDFCRRRPDRALTVTNEDLIIDPDGSMRRVLDFLAVGQEPAPARYLSTHRINSSFKVSGDVANGSPALTEPWTQWLPEQREVFFEEAGETMLACGIVSEGELLAWKTGAASGGTTNPGATLSSE